MSSSLGAILAKKQSEALKSFATIFADLLAAKADDQKKLADAEGKIRDLVSQAESDKEIIDSQKAVIENQQVEDQATAEALDNNLKVILDVLAQALAASPQGTGNTPPVQGTPVDLPQGTDLPGTKGSSGTDIPVGDKDVREAPVPVVIDAEKPVPPSVSI